ncbi:hypothetical protein EJ08DRAFT_703764 [Tothia fuscella]|uniref:Nicotinamide N-methyltransferase n=1 Tax=Tothia fuscella TaxID=1048955 RepID=A0A9P4NE08_9PEZI|nr:hypothetical protein EJ08DRAFT_703764 [Tothia fuscella]
MLSSLLRVQPKTANAEPEPEDLFQSSLGLIFTDDLQNQHGDPGTTVTYRSNGYGDLEFEIADPSGENERTKFAHYLWNAGVLMGEFVGGREKEKGNDSDYDGVWGMRKFEGKREWWLDVDEEEMWKIRGEKVLELGAGVGLVGIMSVLAEAEEVTITDYPAPTIIDTLAQNVTKNIPQELQPKVTVQPHQWGDLTTPFALAKKEYYTRILAADTLWLPQQHLNLAKSMLHFLSKDPGARIFVIAGFHTGRAKMACFFEETLPGVGLEIEEIWEMDADGRRRPWSAVADEIGDKVGERKKWLVVARLRRKVHGD